MTTEKIWPSGKSSLEDCSALELRELAAEYVRHLGDPPIVQQRKRRRTGNDTEEVGAPENSLVQLFKGIPEFRAQRDRYVQERNAKVRL